MVGYQKDDSMTPNQKLIAGCVSGALTRFITQPLDVVKLRTQLHKKDSPLPTGRFFKFSKRIWSEEGIRAFWLGHNMGQLHAITAVSSQFYIYEQTTRFVALNNLDTKYNQSLLTFVCGVMAGCCSAAIVVPLDVIRVRQMLGKHQYRGLLNGAKEVYQQGGILSFYEGLSATMLQVGPAVGLTFVVFSAIQPLLIKVFCGESCTRAYGNAEGNAHHAIHLFIASSVAGCFAGFFSKTLTYPFDLAKRRLQIMSHKFDDTAKTPSTTRDLARCDNLFDCIVHTYREEGWKGLYRGWKITVYKAQLTSVVTFTTYELMCYAMKEFYKDT